jgi:Trp operon repressor
MIQDNELKEKVKKYLEGFNLTKEEEDRLVASINYLSNLLIEECLQREHKKLIRK